MTIDDELVEKLAKLSRLKLDDESKRKMVTDLNKILDLVEKLNELDTENVAPLVYMTDDKPTMRDDKITQSDIKDQILKNGQVKDKDFFKVPKVVKK